MTRRSLITRAAGLGPSPSPVPADLSEVFNENNKTFNIFDKTAVRLLLRKRDNSYFDDVFQSIKTC